MGARKWLGICGWTMALGVSALRADDEVDWVQVHADVLYTREGTASTTADGKFSYRLQVAFDQLLARVAPAGREKWPSFVSLEEYPRVGNVSGTVQMSASGKFDQYQGAADLRGKIATLDQVWIDYVKPQAILFGPALSAEIKVAAPLQGAVKADLPGAGSNPDAAIFLWPTPIKWDAERKAFVSEGSIYVWPPFGTRPKDEQQAIMFDGIKSVVDAKFAGLGGLSTPTGMAQVKGTPSQWELTMSGQGDADTMTGGKYSHHIEVTLKLVPRKLPIPKPIPTPE